MTAPLVPVGAEGGVAARLDSGRRSHPDLTIIHKSQPNARRVSRSEEAVVSPMTALRIVPSDKSDAIGVIHWTISHCRSRPHHRAAVLFRSWLDVARERPGVENIGHDQCSGVVIAGTNKRFINLVCCYADDLERLNNDAPRRRGFVWSARAEGL